MGIRKRQQLLLQVIQVVMSARQGDELLETNNIGVFIVNIIDNLLPRSGILIPLVVIKQPDIVGEQTDSVFQKNRVRMLDLYLEEFFQRIPTQ
jgi:hypothetical protein